jgi:formate dehydrogenase major subunit
VGIRHRIEDQVRSWPVYRQLAGTDRLGRGEAAKSRASGRLAPGRIRPTPWSSRSALTARSAAARTSTWPAGGSPRSKATPASPVSRGRLCPKGSASLQLTTGPGRRYEVLYRRPFGTEWERLDLGTAMDMIADRVIDARRRGWQWEADGARTRRTLGFASLGGATLDNEENYLIKKLFTALGAIQIENQARI